MSDEFKVEYTAFNENGPRQFMVTEKTTFGEFCNVILDLFVKAELERDIIEKTRTKDNKYVIRIRSNLTDKEWITISSISGSPTRWKLRPCHPDLSIFREVPRHFNVVAGYEKMTRK